jgi:hypothetical protein
VAQSQPRGNWRELRDAVYDRGYDIPEPALKRMYRAARKQVRYEHQDAKLRADSISILHRKRKYAEHAIADGLKLHASERARNQLPFWQARHAAIVGELRRKQETAASAASHAAQRSMPLMDCTAADAEQIADERPNTHPDHTQPDLWRSECSPQGFRMMCIADPSWVTPWRQRGGVLTAQRDLAAGRIERREQV